MPRAPRATITTRLQSLRVDNKKMVSRIKALEESPRGTRLSNTLTELVQSFQQSNLTSFNPIIANNIYAPLTLDWMTLTYMYKTHGVIQTAVEMPVLDALRGGLELSSSQLDADDIKDLLDFFEENDIFQAIVETAVWARLFGGAGLIVNILDQDPSKPLKMRQSKAGIQFYAANRWEFGMGYRAENPQGLAMMPAANFDARYSDRYEFYGKEIDKTRVFDMAGKAPPSLLRWQLQGWGMSEVERMVEDFNAYIKTKNVLYELLEEAKLDIFKMEGFNSALLTTAGTQQVFNRLQRANQLKNFNRGLLLDKTDEYEQKQITFSGLAEVMKENRIGIASALRMPMTKLFGLSASGFNSGEDDIENYNAMVESEIRQKIRPIIRKVLKMVCVHLFGAEVDIDFQFQPLRVLSAVEEEQVKTSKQNRALALYDRGLLTPQELMDELGKHKLVATDTAAAQGLLKDRPVPLPGAEGDQDEEGEDTGGEKKGDGKEGKTKEEKTDDAAERKE